MDVSVDFVCKCCGPATSMSSLCRRWRVENFACTYSISFEEEGHLPEKDYGLGAAVTHVNNQPLQRAQISVDTLRGPSRCWNLIALESPLSVEAC